MNGYVEDACKRWAEALRRRKDQTDPEDPEEADRQRNTQAVVSKHLCIWRDGNGLNGGGVNFLPRNDDTGQIVPEGPVGE